MSTTKKGYEEYEPPPILQSYLDCYWSYCTESPSLFLNTKPIIPDGCIDIIFDLSRPATIKSFVVGAMTKPITNNKTNLWGVRFKPGMAYPFIKRPMQKLTDLMIDYYEFVGQESKCLSDQLVDQNTIKNKISILNKMFTQKLSTLDAVEAPIVWALNLIHQTNGKCTIKEICGEIGWSRQHFNRKCLNYTGLNPKFLSQVIRIKELIKRYKSKKFHNWSELSIEGGFYDQSHMINEFKKITGLTPPEFLETP